MKKLVTSVFVLSAAVAFADTAASITGVTAKQRWPWNNLVDVDFTLAAESQQADPYKIEIEAQCADGGPVYAAKSFVTEPVVALGTHRVTWDFGRDFPNVTASNMVFTVTATTFDASQPVYLIVDLSSGPAVKKFPIRYSTVALTPGTRAASRESRRPGSPRGLIPNWRASSSGSRSGATVPTRTGSASGNSARSSSRRSIC